MSRGREHDSAVAYAGRQGLARAAAAAPAPSARDDPPTGWLWFLAAAALVEAAFYGLPRIGMLPAPVLKIVLNNGLGVASTVAIVVGVRRHRPHSRVAWLLVAAGVAAFCVGDFVLFLRKDFLGLDEFPSVADLFYLASYPLSAAGLLILIHRRNKGLDRAGLLDALVLLTGLGLVAWGYVIVPRINSEGLPLVERFVLADYPMMDLLLLATAIRLTVGPGRRSPAFWLLVIGIGALLVADTLYGMVELTGEYETGSPFDVGWMTWYATWGAAALHPSMRALGEPAAAPEARLTTMRIVVLVGVAMLTPTLLTLLALRGTQIGPPILLGGVVVLLAAVSARIRLLAREVAIQAAGRQLLLDRAVRAGEEERVRLASDLHDGPIQRLASLGYVVELAQRRLARGEPTGAEEALRDLERRLGGEIGALRRLMGELRPPVLDEYGLAIALREYAQAFEGRTGVRCIVEDGTRSRLDLTQETVLYRVTQEALTNVAKHAKARTVWVTLSGDGHGGRLEVRDDGVGFDVGDAAKLLASDHYGLASMRARVEMAGGTWLLRSGPGNGTSIVAAVPATSTETAAATATASTDMATATRALPSPLPRP